MGVFSSISKLKALILVFQSPGHSSLCPKAASGKQTPSPQPCSIRGSQPSNSGFATKFTKEIMHSGIIFRGRGAGAGSAALCRCSAPTCGPCSARSHQRRAGWARQTPPLGGTRSRGCHSPRVLLRPLQVRDVGVGGYHVGWVPEFWIQMMGLGVRPVAVPGTAVHCAQASGWRLCLMETWAAARSPSCARGVVGSDLNHRASSSLLLKAARKSLASLKSDLGVVIWRWVVWSGRGGYRGAVLPPCRRWLF